MTPGPDLGPEGERAYLARLAKQIADLGLAPPGVGAGDDTAYVTLPGGESLLLTADAVVEDVHFDLAYCSPADVGWKALSVNVSDIASMGGRPMHALVTVVRPKGFDLDGLFAGLAEAALHYGCSLAGGDLSAGTELVVSVALTGTTDGRAPILRSGAAAGDALYVTGGLGRSAAGLALLQADPGAVSGPLVDAHRRPEALVGEGLAAAAGGASAMIDISDGLASELDHLARGSAVGVSLELVPVADGATFEHAMAGGEDYELLIAAPDPARLTEEFHRRGLAEPIRIGTCTSDGAQRTLEGKRYDSAGYEHRLD
ncbi:MAG TPA: thiamine-phosphate kinase [Acidimicrobiales bacterium]|nr:thiamine-phosphate kinase [Acidimicrobiales bacterium]